METRYFEISNKNFVDNGDIKEGSLGGSMKIYEDKKVYLKVSNFSSVVYWRLSLPSRGLGSLKSTFGTYTWKSENGIITYETPIHIFTLKNGDELSDLELRMYDINGNDITTTIATFSIILQME